MSQKVTRHVLGTLAALFLCLSVAGSAWAGPNIYAIPSACNWLNCASTTIRTNVLTSSSIAGGGMDPFIIQVQGGQGACTRLDVLNQNADMEIVVVSPNGTVWRNDDRPGSLRPLVVFPSGLAGWYTVQVSVYNGFTGAPGVHYNADLAYGRYTGGANVNCANPTPAQLVHEDAPGKGMASMPRDQVD